MNSLAVEVQEPRARSLKVSDEELTADLVDGRTIMVPLAWFPRLWHGTPQECNHFEIFGDGRFSPPTGSGVKPRWVRNQPCSGS
jgi:hypothetical protein